jgi:hypothetical protein
MGASASFARGRVAAKKRVNNPEKENIIRTS